MGFSHVDTIFSLLNSVLGHLQVAKSLPSPKDQLSTGGHLLAASNIYEASEFITVIGKVEDGLQEEGDTIRVYKQALISRLIHYHDLCVLPRTWEKEIRTQNRMVKKMVPRRVLLIYLLTRMKIRTKNQTTVTTIPLLPLPNLHHRPKRTFET